MDEDSGSVEKQYDARDLELVREQYSMFVDMCARERAPYQIPTCVPAHSAVILGNIFKTGRQYVNILLGGQDLYFTGCEEGIGSFRFHGGKVNLIASSKEKVPKVLRGASDDVAFYGSDGSYKTFVVSDGQISMFQIQDKDRPNQIYVSYFGEKSKNAEFLKKEFYKLRRSLR